MHDENMDILRDLIHDARKPLNAIAMHAELIKLAMDGALPQDKAIEALDKIIQSTQECSQTLAQIDQHASDVIKGSN